MDYYSDTAYTQQDPYASVDSYEPPAKKPSPVGNNSIPEDEVVVLKEKVKIPIDKHPGYNFVGSLLGPQGSILKELCRATRSRIAILGKGSMKDKQKEEELCNSDEAEHAHLKEPLHVLIDIKAPRAEAHRRMADALIEVYKFMIPQGNAGPGQQYDGSFNAYGGGGYGRGGYGGEGMYGPPRGGPPRGRGGPPRGAGRGRGGGRGAPRGGGY